MLKRLGLMTTVVAITLTVAACGRATEDQINQALGITPTATMSAEQIVESTAAASATSAARELALASPGAAAAGDVTAGKRQFDTWCIGCHGPGGVGPDILSPGSPGSTVDPATLPSDDPGRRRPHAAWRIQDHRNFGQAGHRHRVVPANLARELAGLGHQQLADRVDMRTHRRIRGEGFLDLADAMEDRGVVAPSELATNFDE